MAEIPPHKSDAKSSKTSKRDRQASDRRKVVEKTVVRVRIEENVGRLKSEGPPSDMWSWRKYGQKPIKGSPYPRGYYKCSSSKGCSAKKHVERCKTDGSLLIITYTSSHNHPDPDHHRTNQTQQSHQNEAISTTPIKSPNQPSNTGEDANCNSNLQSPINSPADISKEDQLTTLGKAHEPITLLFDERPLSHPNLMTISAPKSEENDIYDELEELPISSSFTSMMRTSFFDERILV